MTLLGSLLSGLKAVCGGFPDARKGRGGNIAMADFGLSAFAMFFMQSASFLSFQRLLEKGEGRSNCQSLFGMDHPDPLGDESALEVIIRSRTDLRPGTPIDADRRESFPCNA